jgi:metallo-beta-lactamase class B
MAMAEDVPALRAMQPGGKEHPIDRVLDDGDEVTLGSTTLTAHRTPGHTKGCTSWGLEVEEGGQTYDALVICSFGVNPNYVLVGNRDYPEIAADYAATFAKARTLPVDEFLAPHGSQYGLAEKHAKLASRGPNDPNPFIDRAGYLAHIDLQEQRFKDMLAEQQANADEAARGERP